MQNKSQFFLVQWRSKETEDSIRKKKKNKPKTTKKDRSLCHIADWQQKHDRIKMLILSNWEPAQHESVRARHPSASLGDQGDFWMGLVAEPSAKLCTNPLPTGWHLGGWQDTAFPAQGLLLLKREQCTLQLQRATGKATEALCQRLEFKRRLFLPYSWCLGTSINSHHTPQIYRLFPRKKITEH